MALDYFDASINRVAAWTLGYRNVQKALLLALCTPNDKLKELQDKNKLTELLVLQESLKNMPFNEIWDEYCRVNKVPLDDEWYKEVLKYEEEVQLKRV